MSTQIAIRLPDDLVRYLDEVAKSEPGGSRASVVRAALERDRRARLADRDARILAELGDYDDLDGLTAYMQSHIPPIED